MATARPFKSTTAMYTKPMWRSMATAVNQQQQNSAVTTITEDKGFGSGKLLLLSFFLHRSSNTI
jgi:NADH dehydrogenase (ubiquinone) Fe-S protein 2